MKKKIVIVSSFILFVGVLVWFFNKDTEEYEELSQSVLWTQSTTETYNALMEQRLLMPQVILRVTTPKFDTTTKVLFGMMFEKSVAAYSIGTDEEKKLLKMQTEYIREAFRAFEQGERDVAKDILAKAFWKGM